MHMTAAQKRIAKDNETLGTLCFITAIPAMGFSAIACANRHPLIRIPAALAAAVLFSIAAYAISETKDVRSATDQVEPASSLRPRR